MLSLNSSSSHLAGGMTYSNGGVTVPIAGRYYIYTQMFMTNKGHRIYVMVNSKIVTMIQPILASLEHTTFAAGVFKLKAGDVILLKVNNSFPVTVYKSMYHCYFGAYLI